MGSHASRRLLTEPEADAIVDGLRRGIVRRVEDARFPDRYQVRLRKLGDVAFINAELWLTVEGGFVGRGRLERCEFIDCVLDPLTIFKSDVRDSSFDGVKIGARAMGIVDGCRLEAVRMASCRVSDFAFRNGRLADVDIADTTIDAVRFESCSLDRVGIAGALDDVPFLRCDFTGSRVAGSPAVDVAFHDWIGADVTLPQARDGFFVTPDQLRADLDRLTPDMSAATREHLIRDVLADVVGLVVVSEIALRRELPTAPGEVATIVDALHPHRLRRLADVVQQTRGVH